MVPAYIRMGQCDSDERMATSVTAQYKTESGWQNCSDVQVTDYHSINSFQDRVNGDGGMRNVPIECSIVGVNNEDSAAQSGSTTWKLTVKSVHGGGDQVQLDEIALLDANQSYIQLNARPVFGHEDTPVDQERKKKIYMSDNSNACNQQTNQNGVTSGRATFTYTFGSVVNARFIRIGHCDSPSRMATRIGVACKKESSWHSCNDVVIDSNSMSSFQANIHGDAGLQNLGIS